MAKALEGGFPTLARIVHAPPAFEAVLEAARAAAGQLIHGYQPRRKHERNRRATPLRDLGAI